MPAGPPIIAAVFAWLHLIAAGIAAGLLMTEYWLCRRVPDRLQAKLLAMVDLGYVLALIASLATGLARALYYGQEPGYYLGNRLFWLKMALFLVIGAVAVAPSIQYFRWGRQARATPAFSALMREVERVRANVAFGLGLWLIVPLVAILVARGYG
jgi:putative membrane protein